VAISINPRFDDVVTPFDSTNVAFSKRNARQNLMANMFRQLLVDDPLVLQLSKVERWLLARLNSVRSQFGGTRSSTKELEEAKIQGRLKETKNQISFKRRNTSIERTFVEYKVSRPSAT